MIMNEPALLELFYRLQSAGLPLGLEQYYLLLQALDAGFGQNDRNSLAQLCCTLWVKSEEEQLIFQEYFDLLIPERTPLPILSRTRKASQSLKSIADSLKADYINTKKPKSVRWIRYVAFGIISSLITAIIFILYSLLSRQPPTNSAGILSFKTMPFSDSLGTILENEKNAKIRIARTGGSKGKVSATIQINETDDYFAGMSLNTQNEWRWRSLLEKLNINDKYIDSKILEDYTLSKWERLNDQEKDEKRNKKIQELLLEPKIQKELIKESALYDLDDPKYIDDTHITISFYNNLFELKYIASNPITVTFYDGEMGEKEISIPIFDDDVFEGNEKVIFKLIDPHGGVKITTQSTATLTIADDFKDIEKVYPSWFSILGEWFSSWGELFLITISILLIILIAIRFKSISKRINAADDKDTDDRTNLPIAKLSPQVIQTLLEEVQVPTAIKQPYNQLGDNFTIITQDIPITYRQIKQGWRHLRHLIQEGVPTELDIEETIHQIGQQGFLLNPVLKPRRINKIELLLLIDQDGSMVPFHHLSQALVDTASKGGRFNQVRVYYFHNCPNDYLYTDPYHLKAVPIEDCLSQLPKTRVVCLIFSDAGAAHEQFNSKRRRHTKFFLKELKQYVQHIAWLNPFPRKRWESTTAAEIAELVPMFEINRQEFYQTIETLRGRKQQSGKSIR